LASVRGCARLQRKSAVACKRHHRKTDNPECREFPTAIGIGEEEAGCAMDREDRTEQDRNQGSRSNTRIDADDQRDGTNYFPEDGDIGEPARQTERSEEGSFRPAWARNRMPSARRRMKIA
jgi:hypothetical protein